MTKIKHPHSRAERRRLSEKKKDRNSNFTVASYTARPSKSPKEGTKGDSIDEDIRSNNYSQQSPEYAIRYRDYPG